LTQKQQAALMVVRESELQKVHPRTDFRHHCAICQQPVGVFPSGQRLMRRYAVTLICTHCMPPAIAAPFAPGAYAEQNLTRRR